MRHLFSTFSVVTVAVLVNGSGCDPGGTGIIAPDQQVQECTASDQCATGTICMAGACTPGSCDPALEAACDAGDGSDYCCKAWENCDTLSLTCARDEDSPIGCRPDEPGCQPCGVDADCPTAGQFCSGGRCFDTAGRSGCTSSFQCPAGERCDRTVFLCVPDRGGCQYCSQLAELCCEEDETCSDQTGFCIELPDPECEVEADCAAGTFCDDLQRCIQCDLDHPCGPGLDCDTGTGECYSVGLVCTSDDGCPGDSCQCQGAKRCAVNLGQCVIPECVEDTECREGNDTRRRCNHDSFRCELPPPVCDFEEDEDNDGTSTATPVGDDLSYAGLLCRSDTDVLSFAVIPNRRYIATIDFGGSGQNGIAVAMLDTLGSVESSNVFTQTQAELQVSGATSETESGLFYVRIIGGNIDRDQWSYTVSVVEEEASAPADCTPAGQPEEPNDTTATAHALTVGQTTTVTRCGTDDEDYYSVTLPAQSGVRVTVAGFYNAEGNLNVTLFKGSNPTSQVDQSVSTNDVEVVDGPEGEATYLVRVRLSTAAGALEDQVYTIRAESVPRPAECSPDPTEPDDTLANAAPLPTVVNGDGTVSGSLVDVVRCNPQDVDHFNFTMPAGLSGSVLLSFNHNEGDIKLELYEPDGTLVDTSNVSNSGSEPDEQIEVPGSATDPLPYVARVLLGSTSATNIIGQKYTISLVTFDNSQCLASEPSGGDNTFVNGICVGAFVPDAARPCIEADRTAEPLDPGGLAACQAAPDGTAGCGRVCGNEDDDFYRLGVLNNDQVVRATLEYPVGQGTMSLVLVKLNTTGTIQTVGTAQTDSNSDGIITLQQVIATVASTSAREHAIRIDPTGTTGHQAEPYSLRIDVGDACFDDENDTGDSNERPETSTLIRNNPQGGAPYSFNSATEFSSSRCNNDVDVYEFFGFSGENVAVELVGATGLIAELGTRPDDLSDPAEMVITATAGAGPQVYDNPISQQLFLTVKAATGAVVTGPYTLTLSTTP